MASKRFGFVLTEAAELDIDETLAYIAEDLSNPTAASSFVDELEQKIDVVCKTPENGRPVGNEFLRRDDIRRFLVGNYIAYYIIDDVAKNIVILRVVYGGRDQNKILKGIM